MTALFGKLTFEFVLNTESFEKQEMNFETLFSKISHDLGKTRDGREISNWFSACSTDTQRVSFVLRQEPVKACFQDHIHLFKQKIFAPHKSESLSLSHCVSADDYHQQKLNWKSICYYNHSLLVGEGEALAVVYAHRSAVFYDMADWLHSLRDLQLALDQGYPKHLEHKLRERQGDCLLELGYISQSFVCFNLAKDLLTMLPNSQHKVVDITLKLKQVKNKQRKSKKLGVEDTASMSTVKSIEQEIIRKRRSVPELHLAKNPLLPSASISVELMDTADRGRCLVATEDLHIGATIIVEKAHASILLEEFKESHCHHCLNWTPGPVPCHRCSQVGFCTTLCRDESWASYHQHECGLLDLLHSSTRDVNTGQHGLLALRTILKAGKKKISVLNEQAKSCVNSSSASMLFDSADYGAVRSLVGNATQRSVADLFRRTVMAVYLMTLIKQDDEPDVEMVTALLHLLQSYPCNAHEISHLAVPLPYGPHARNQSLQLQQVRPCEIGAAIMPVVSLMNHSCNPNVVHVCYGDVMVVKVIRRIRKGEEIFDNYGYHYATHDKKERQSKLRQQYYFRCLCQPCVEDWPLYGDTPKLENRSAISHALVKDINDLKKIVCYYPKGPAKLEESVQLFIRHVDTIESDQSISLPVQEYIQVLEILKHCFSISATLSPHLVI